MFESPETVHLTLNVSGPLYDAVQARAAQAQTTETVAIHQALALYLFLLDKVDAGDHVLLQHADGRLQEVYVQAFLDESRGAPCR